MVLPTSWYVVAGLAGCFGFAWAGSGRRRPVEAEVGVAEAGRPAAEGAERARRQGGDRGLLEGRALVGRRGRIPRERAVMAVGGRVEREAEVGSVLERRAVVEEGR